MANIKVVDQAVVLTTELTNEQIARAEKYFPEALELANTNKDGEREVYFVVKSTYNAAPVVEASKFGVEFPYASKEDKARVTYVIPKLAKEKVTTYVKDRFGVILRNLLLVEAQFKAMQDEFDKAYKALEANITIE